MHETNIQSSCLKISNLELNLNMGITKDEQKHKQLILVTIHITNTLPPKGCHNDNINDTLCYDKLCSSIIQKCENKVFHLIEHLCHEILTITCNQVSNLRGSKDSNLMPNLTNKTKIQVTINKNPPIDALPSACFSLNAIL